jgi:hypothetical protein
MKGQAIEILKEINYLGVILDSSGKWDEQKKAAQRTGNQALSAIDRCSAKTPCIEVRTLEKIYEMLVETRMLYGVEVWGIHEARKEMDVIHTRFCKKILGVPRRTVIRLCSLRFYPRNNQGFPWGAGPCKSQTTQ